MITIFKKDTIQLIVTVLDDNNVPIDLTGFNSYFTVKKQHTDTDAKAVIPTVQGTTDDPLKGEITFDISTDMTDLEAGLYYYDVVIYNADINTRYTVKQDQFIVKASILNEIVI